MSDQPTHAVYTKLLLRQSHGRPLWIPEPDSNLPDVYRDKGVSVGDLVILTDDGGYDFLFNVCAEADDPVNRDRVPPRFQPLRIPSSHAIRRIPYIHCRNASIASAHVSKRTIAVEGSAEMTPFVTGGGGFEFSTSKAEAAILMLPDGGNRYDTRRRELFQQYAYKNGLSWYEYAQWAPNGTLYLVTGCDKARSWMTAAATCPSKSHTISVKFAVGPIVEGRIVLHSYWSTPRTGADSTRVHPNYPDPMPQQDNQCVFMRGFTISVRENSLMQRIRGPVQLKVIGGSSADAAPSFHSQSPSSSHQGDTTGSSSSGVLSSTGPVDSFDMPNYLTNDDPNSLLNDDVELSDLPGRSTELLNPSAKINERILTLYPHVTVAITHDEDWMEVTKDLPPDEWPDDFKLASMVLGLLEKRSTKSFVLSGQQPLGELEPSALSRPTTTRPRTTDDPACTPPPPQPSPPLLPVLLRPSTPSMSPQNLNHHHSEGGSRDKIDDGLDLRVLGAQNLETDLVDSLDADDLVCQCIMSLEALTVYEHISPEALTAEESIHLEALTPHVQACLLSFEQDRNVRSLDKAITLCEFAISRYPDGDIMQSGHFWRLGLALEMKGLQDKALGAYERALDLAPEDSWGLELRSVCFYKIGALHQGRYDQHEEVEDLNKAIWAHEMCIAFTAADGKYLDECYGDLFCSLKARWELLKDEEDLDRLVSYAEKSIAFNPSYHNQFNLGIALRMSYEHHHTLALVDRAILAMQSAVSNSMPHDRMHMLTELAFTYYRRIHHVRDPSDASACIKYLEQAMEYGMISFSLHIMLIKCLTGVFFQNGDVQSYERACSTCETLLADDSLTNINRCIVLTALGAIHLISCVRRAHSPDTYVCRLEKCIQTLERAISCMSPRQPEPARPYYLLSYALHGQLLLGTATVSEFEYAISIGRKAIEFSEIHAASERTTLNTDSHASCLMTLGGILMVYGYTFPQPRAHYEECVSLFHQASRVSSLIHDVHIMSSIAEAECCFSKEDWKACFNAYTDAIEAVQHQTWLGLSVVQQYRAIGGVRNIDAVGRHAARTAVRFGSSGMALGWIEQCRSIVWRRVLNLRVSMDTLADVEPTLAHRLKEVSDMLQRDAYLYLLGMEEGSSEMRKQQRYRLAKEWEDLVAQTRSLLGFTDFLKPKDSAYFASCEFGGMVVLLNVYQKGCDAIVLGSNKGKVVTFPLRDMNEGLATALQTRLRETLRQSSRLSRNARASETWFGRAGKDVMSDVLSVLWKTVVKPLFDFLDLKPHDSSSESDPPRLWWCPTGPLSFLPLHAAGRYDSAKRGTKVYEFVASSYTPTVGILADISKQLSEEFSGLLTVCQPHTPGQHPIPKTEDEVCSVVQAATESGLAMDITSLDNDDATPEAVLSGMAEHSWIHLACYARQDPTQPLESAFMLAGDPKEGRPLKLTEIAERANTKADFAFLSACQTATGDVSLSEEPVPLAAGMLMAGYRRVIATMWAVNDSDAPIIAEMVYKHMLSDGKADSGKSCLALHYATASMRQKVGEKNFMSWVPFIHYGA